MHKYIAKEPTGEVYRVEKLDKDVAVAQGLHRTDPQEFSLVVEKQPSCQSRSCSTRSSEYRTALTPSFYWTKRRLTLTFWSWRYD